MSQRNASSSSAQLSAQVPGSTPALFDWLSEQLHAGFESQALLQALVQRGWSNAIAQQAIRLLTTESPGPHSLPSGPAPALHNAPSAIDVGDRQVEVLLSIEHPQIVLFGNVLSDAECDAIIAAARPYLHRSRTVQTQTGGEEINSDRTSEGMFFQRGQTLEVGLLETRLAHLLQWPVENGEGLQVLHYRPGAQYKPHHDYFDPAEPGTPRILHRGGQRVGTVIVYLNEPEAGGATFFPETRLRVHPRRGHAVFFGYEKPVAETLTLHGGEPVLSGEKWIATKWLRERHFQ